MHNRLNALFNLRKAENSMETIECSSLNLVHWFPPFLGWTKINADEATNGSPGHGNSCGGILEFLNAFEKDVSPFFLALPLLSRLSLLVSLMQSFLLPNYTVGID